MTTHMIKLNITCNIGNSLHERMDALDQDEHHDDDHEDHDGSEGYEVNHFSYFWRLSLL